MLQQEIQRRGTIWPEGSYTLIEVRGQLEASGTAVGSNKLHELISGFLKNGTLKRIEGHDFCEKRGRLVRAVRYIVP